MRPNVMIIFKIGFENLSQLTLVEHNHSIQAFSPYWTHQPHGSGEKAPNFVTVGLWA
jgi:hypothetical protein